MTPRGSGLTQSVGADVVSALIMLSALIEEDVEPGKTRTRARIPPPEKVRDVLDPKDVMHGAESQGAT